MASATRSGVFFFAAALVLGAPLGCGDDDQDTVSVGPTGKPTLAIVAPQDGACVPIGAGDPNATVPVRIAVTELYLRPPGTCGDYVQCGHILVRVNGQERLRSAGTVIDVPMLADAYAELTISLEVMSDAGQPILDKEPEPRPLQRSITVTTRETCDTASGGAGGSGGSGGGGDAGGSGGAGGGAGGSGGAGGGAGGSGGA